MAERETGGAAILSEGVIAMTSRFHDHSCSKYDIPYCFPCYNDLNNRPSRSDSICGENDNMNPGRATYMRGIARYKELEKS
jgi:hypothetical protein